MDEQQEQKQLTQDQIDKINSLTGIERRIANIEPHKWLKGMSGNPNGRPRKYVTLMAKEGYKPNEIKDTLTALLSLTVSELHNVYTHQDSTALEKAVAHAIKKAIEKGSLYNIESVLSRAFGLPTQQQEVKAEVSMKAFVVRNISTGVPLSSNESEIIEDITPISETKNEQD